jgi:hypothetical protein
MADNEEELKKGEFHAQSYSLSSVKTIFNDLMSNPLIKLVVIDE